jgi:8-oxo-dGTP pyrophosphatase MutT (NUDIX family)
MTFEMISQIEECLKKELPGPVAQSLMAPSIRPPGIENFDGSSPRSSGVMILLFPGDHGLNTVFILRTQGGMHGGQISLPGGKQEPTDIDLAETAKRETFEEIGVDPRKIEVIGELTPLYVPHSNFIIQPVIGYVSEFPRFVMEQREVCAIIQTSIADLFDPKNRKSMVLDKSGVEITAPYYDVEGHRIWGATAMIISEFERLVISCISL